jgi:hypothetical protein
MVFGPCDQVLGNLVPAPAVLKPDERIANRLAEHDHTMRARLCPRPIDRNEHRRHRPQPIARLGQDAVSISITGGCVHARHNRP